MHAHTKAKLLVPGEISNGAAHKEPNILQGGVFRFSWPHPRWSAHALLHTILSLKARITAPWVRKRDASTTPLVLMCVTRAYPAPSDVPTDSFE